MIIEYFNKKVEPISTPEITGIWITYDISEEDMFSLANSITGEYEERKIFLKEINSNKIDLVVDNIITNRVVQGGLTKEGKYQLNYYIIEKGIEDLLKLLEPHK